MLTATKACAAGEAREGRAGWDGAEQGRAGHLPSIRNRKPTDLIFLVFKLLGCSPDGARAGQQTRAYLFSLIISQLASLLLADVGEQLAVLLRDVGCHSIVAQPPCQPFNHHSHLCKQVAAVAVAENKVLCHPHLCKQVAAVAENEKLHHLQTSCSCGRG